jgi:hypothetical protein
MKGGLWGDSDTKTNVVDTYTAHIYLYNISLWMILSHLRQLACRWQAQSEDGLRQPLMLDPRRSYLIFHGHKAMEIGYAKHLIIWHSLRQSRCWYLTCKLHKLYLIVQRVVVLLAQSHIYIYICVSLRRIYPNQALLADIIEPEDFSEEHAQSNHTEDTVALACMICRRSQVCRLKHTEYLRANDQHPNYCLS